MIDDSATNAAVRRATPAMNPQSTTSTRTDRSPTPRGVTRVLVDSDGGVDDVAALWYLLVRDDVVVAGITVTAGNVDVATAADNLARVCQLAGVDVPIALGDGGAYGPHPQLRPADFIHGVDGVGDTGRRPRPWSPDPRPAIDLIADVVTDRPGEVVLVTLGPLTNAARFVDAHPHAVGLVDRLVVMGGTTACHGNALPIGEANIAHDPSAAATVATAPWSRPPMLVGLDVTLQATLTEAEFELLAEERSAAAADLHAPLAFYRRHGGTFSPPGEFPCHDLTAAIVAIEPGLVSAPVLPLGVDTSGGLAWGTTVVDRRRPFFERAGPGSTQSLPDGMADWQVCLDIDVAATRARYRRLFDHEERA